MIQKIIKVGNSAAITIPKEFLREAHIRIGEEIAVETYPRAKTLLVKPKEQDGKMVLTPEFYQWLEAISEKYEDVIKELAQK